MFVRKGRALGIVGLLIFFALPANAALPTKQEVIDTMILVMSATHRTAVVDRTTSESTVHVEVDLDGNGRTEISTTVPFYDHMLTALGKHSLIDLVVRASGDTDIDVHHTVEDVAIALGQALARRWATRRASAGSVTPSCRWTRPWPRQSSTCPGAPTASTPVSRRARSTT